MRLRAERLSGQAQEARARHRSVDALFDIVDRDAEVGGGIIAGALAYRFFIWLLPLGLVLVAGLGIAADASSTSPENAAETAGFRGLITSSVASAANSPARWYALGIGLFGLLLATRSVLRVLIGAHRLIWTDVRAVAPRPTLVATLRLLARRSRSRERTARWAAPPHSSSCSSCSAGSWSAEPSSTRRSGNAETARPEVRPKPFIHFAGWIGRRPGASSC